MQEVTDCEHSSVVIFRKKGGKRLATVNEVNPLFLRKYSAKLMTASKASAFALRKVRWNSLTDVELIRGEYCEGRSLHLALWCKISDSERSEYASFAQGEVSHFVYCRRT